MITAEQAWENAATIIQRMESEDKLNRKKELEEWMVLIDTASKAGATFISVENVYPSQAETLKRLGFRVTDVLGKNYICWARYNVTVEPKKSFWQRVLEYVRNT